MTNYDITALEDAFITVVKNAGICNNVYPNRPKSKETEDNFAVVSVSADLEDNACYGNTVVAVDLFAKDVKNLKNGKKLKFMYERLMSSMPKLIAGRYLVDENPTIVPDSADDYGFHARVIEFNITIKIQ